MVCGAGALIGPLLVSANIKINSGFHGSFWVIGAATALSALPFLVVGSPQPPRASKASEEGHGGDAIAPGWRYHALFVVFFAWYFFCEPFAPALSPSPRDLTSCTQTRRRSRRWRGGYRPTSR